MVVHPKTWLFRIFGAHDAWSRW